MNMKAMVVRTKLLLSCFVLSLPLPFFGGTRKEQRKQKLGSKRVGDKNEGRDWLGRQERSAVLQQYGLM